MNPNSAQFRGCSFCLILTLVLFLGLVQWSFLPLLIDNQMPSQQAALEISSGHTSKFAAPFKGLFGDSSSPWLPQSGVFVPTVTPSFFHRSAEPSSNWEARYFSHRQLRAPPSA